MDDRFKKRFTYADTQKEDCVDSPLPDSSAPILARAEAAWNENGDPGVKAFIATLSGPERQQLAEEIFSPARLRSASSTTKQ